MKYIWRSILVLTGLLILALSAPHNSPWAMKYIRSSLDESTMININFFGSEMAFSASVLWRSLALLFVGMILVTPSARRAVRTLVHQPRRLIILLLSLSYLIFTLKPSRQGWQMVLYLVLGFVSVIMILIGASHPIDALILKLRGHGKRIAGWFFGMPAWKLLALLFAWVFTATNLACYFIFEHIPHIVDSVDQVFHGKIFLLGRLTVPSPEPRAFFNCLHMINNGKWYSQYPPGHSLLYSFGHILHAPWVINPLFGSLSAVLLYFIAKEMYDEKTGRFAVILAALSPLLIFMAAGFMNHTTTLFFIELFLLGFARMVNRRRVRDALLVGFALGYALSIRPMTAAAVGAPFAIYAIFKLVRLAITSRKESLRFGALCCVSLAVFGVMLMGLLTFNHITNGDLLLFGYVALHGKNHNPGFGPRGLFHGKRPYTPGDGFNQMLKDLNALNKYLFEIPIPALLLVILALISPRANIWDLLLIVCASSLVFAHFFYWAQCWGYGPRFIFESTGALLILSARGIMALPDIAHHLFGITNRLRVKGYAALVLVLCFCVGFPSNVPPLVRVYSDSYWGINGQVQKAVKKMGITNALVFVKGGKAFESVFAENHPLLKSDIVYAIDLGKEKNVELMEKFQGRKFYVADGPLVVAYPFPLESKGGS